ncbi:Tetratricopeptide repeat,FKBP-type peptidyl-prolyl cis-trans isomerase domain,Tetratricopeptide-like [Cinara cedri]|uniref:peptidylprolyl isomerase n=1 Tax=Cinara cedri TaxID=506608 RepID=A0A5E4N6U7_9HEMI|nr:Tetratricopeptide repeat,FKBP-type peptidyl-prolyl cis-trans isomerase domain,Tetratricopeptide-like [Cinara cedri]
MSNEEKLDDLSDLDSVLRKVSQEILSKQADGYCFSVDNAKTANENVCYSPYNVNEVADYVNFDMLGDESEDTKPFNHLIVDNNYEDITNDGGVLKLVRDPGVGEVVPENSIVLLHYTGYISNLHEPFDVTYLQGKRPKHFQLGFGDLLSGLEIGVLTMKHGENARFIISPKYGFGKMGCPPRIPPNSTVLFDVHLVSYFPPGVRIPRHFKEAFNLDKCLEAVRELHFEGNQCYKRNKIENAIFKYEKAKELLHLIGNSKEEEEIEIFKYFDKLYSNLSICYLKLYAFKKVCRMGVEGMMYSERFSKNNVKLWFNWGKALRFLKDFTEGKRKLLKALQLEPYNLTTQYELERLERDRELHLRVDSFVKFKNATDEDNKRLPPEFWSVFDIMITEFVDSSDDLITVKLNDNSDDIELAEHKANLRNLKVQRLQNDTVNINYFVIKKEL